LRDSIFRSTAWRILLGSLPLDKDLWIQKAKQNRDNYKIWKEKIPANPREEVFDMDLGLNNPLSLHSGSPWQQYFEDQEIKDIIAKDVNRTFPEVNFFASDSVRQVLSDILFIYAKRNPKISYRQGMHEILAPLLFVLHADRQSFDHFQELQIETDINETDLQILKTLNDPRFIEHDAYDLFSKAMDIVEGFYTVADENFLDQSVVVTPSPSTPFSLFVSEKLEKVKRKLSFRNEGTKPKAPWISKLEIIYDQKLRFIDFALWNHLNTLDISPRLFGLRWLRLLYGREFPFPDLLFLWDVIFTDRPRFTIIEDIFVAMLIQIRSLLLNADYSTAMQYLMRYPPISDVQAFIQYCLHLHSPKDYYKPATYGVTHFSHITVAGKPHPNQDRKDQFNNFTKKVNNGRQQQQRDFRLLRINSYSAQSSPHHFAKQPSVEPMTFGESTFYTNGHTSMSSLKEVELMKEQVSILQSNLNDKDLVSRVAASRLLKLISDIDLLSGDSTTKSSIKSELKDIAETLSRSTVPEFTIRSVPLKIDPGQMRGAVEVAKEAGSPLRPPTLSGPLTLPLPGSFRPLSRSISRSLRNENELKELHFDRKKNF
jgi:TBC1 domain family protein 5